MHDLNVISYYAIMYIVLRSKFKTGDKMRHIKIRVKFYCVMVRVIIRELRQKFSNTNQEI